MVQMGLKRLVAEIVKIVFDVGGDNANFLLQILQIVVQILLSRFAEKLFSALLVPS